jgi:hypothetical protein
MEESPKIERNTLEHTNILIFLKDFFHATQIFYLYPSHHPKVAQSIENLHGSYNNLLKNNEILIISTIKNDLLFNAVPLEAPNADVRNFASFMYENSIASITFTGTIEQDSLKKIMEIFSRRSREQDTNLVDSLNSAGINQVKLERISYKEIFSRRTKGAPADESGEQEDVPVSSSLIDYLKGRAENLIKTDKDTIKYGKGNDSGEGEELNESDDESVREIAQKPAALKSFLQKMASGQSEIPVDELVEMVERLGIYLETYHYEDSNIYLKNLSEIVCSLDPELRMNIMGHCLERCSRARGSKGTSMEQFVKKMVENITLALVEENQSSSSEMFKIFKQFSHFPDVAKDMGNKIKKSLNDTPSLSEDTLKIFNELFVKNQEGATGTSSYLEHLVKVTKKDEHLPDTIYISQKRHRYMKLLTDISMMQQVCRLQIELIRSEENQDDKEALTKALKGFIIKVYEQDNKENFLALFEYLTSEKFLLEFFIKELSGSEIIRDLFLNFQTLTKDVRERLSERLVMLRNITLYFIMDTLNKIEDEEQKQKLINSFVFHGLLSSVNISYFLPKLKSDKWMIVQNIVIILGEIKDISVVPDLINLLKHEEPEVVRTVVKALEKIDSTEATGGLLEFLKNSDETFIPDIMDILLASPTEKKVISILNIFFNRPSLSRTCMEATVPRLLLAIGQCRGEAAMPFIDDIYKNKNNIFAETDKADYLIAETLEMINTPKARTLLRKVMKNRSHTSGSIWDKMLKNLFKTRSS